MADGDIVPGVMKIKEYNDGESYWRVACECSDPRHDAELWFEVDKEYGDMSLNLSMEVGVYPNRYQNIFETFGKRVATAFKILFTGHFETQGNVLLSNENVKALQYAIEKGTEHAERVRNEKLANRRPPSGSDKETMV